MNEELLEGLTDEQKEAFMIAKNKLNMVKVKSKSKRIEIIFNFIKSHGSTWVSFLDLLLELMKMDPENKLKWRHENLRFYLAKLVKSGDLSSRKSETFKSKEYSITSQGVDSLNSNDESNQNPE